MKTKRARWAVMLLIAVIALVSAAYLLPPLARERIRPQRRSQAVNNIAPVFDTNQSTNPASTASTKKR